MASCHKDEGQREERRGVREHVADARVRRRCVEQPRVPDDDRRLENRAALQHTAIRIDDAADAGVGGSYKIAPFLDRADRCLLEMLIRR